MSQAEDILVVEDERIIAEMLSSILEDEGFRVTCTSSYAEAMEAAQAAMPPFSYLVSDVNLGSEQDGIDVAQAVVARQNGAKAILLTGDDARKYQARLPANAAILEKPCMPHELVAALRADAD